MGISTSAKIEYGELMDKYARTNNICLVFITMVVATIALIYMKPVLIPLIFSIFAYSMLTPMVHWIRKTTKAPKMVAVLFSLLLLFFSLTLIVAILVTSVEDFVQGAPKYKDSLAGLIQLIENNLTRFNIELDLEQLKKMIRSTSFLNHFQRLTGQLLSFMGNLFLVFIFVMFMMTGETRSQKKGPMLSEVLEKISSYISAKFLLSLATGSLVWIVLAFYQVELAFIFAFLTVLFNFIPTIGSIIAFALPLPVVLLQFGLGIDFTVIAALTGAVQIIIGNIIEPKMMGDSMDLHPVTVMVCLVFWGMVWGVAGMFLAVPVTAVLKIVFSKVEATQNFAEILAGRLSSNA